MVRPQSAASIQKRPLIKKYYFNPYFCGLYLSAACNESGYGKYLKYRKLCMASKNEDGKK